MLFKTKYCCEHCGKKFFEEDADYRDDGGYEEYWGAKVWMPYNVPICPSCGSDDLTEADDEVDEEEREELENA